MAGTPIFIGTVAHGKVHLDRPKQYQSYIDGLKPDQKVKVVVKPFKAGDNIRSVEANAYYWAVVIEELRQYFGYEKEEMHDALGLLFRRDFDGALPTVTRTSTMSTKMFWDYIEAIRRWAAAEYGLYIPDPNEVEFGGRNGN